MSDTEALTSDDPTPEEQIPYYLPFHITFELQIPTDAQIAEFMGEGPFEEPITREAYIEFATGKFGEEIRRLGGPGLASGPGVRNVIVGRAG